MKLAALLIAFALVGAAAFADDEQGGDIQGTEQLHQEILLTATTNAPAGATGKAELEAENEDGVNSAAMKIEARGLAPGNYAVTLTRKSDGSVVELGTFGGSEDEPSETGDDDVEIEFGTEDGLPLPDDLSPLDIAGVSIIDVDGHAVLSGNFMDALKASFRARIAVTGKATGTAVIHTRTRHGMKTERFKLNVKGVTPDATLALKINGQDFGTVTTDANGKLRLNSLPEGIEPESLILMEFADSEGTNALTINF